MRTTEPAAPSAAPPTPSSISLDRLAFDKLLWQAGAATIRVERLELSEVVLTAVMPPQPWQVPDVHALSAKQARLQGVHASLTGAGLPDAAAAPAGPWRLNALADLEGKLEAFITDAAWSVDADVTVPIREGRIDFNRVAVEHIGPDSSMGLSHLGLYVDALNGRTYLFMLSASHVPGARFEKRGGSLFGARVSDRGALELRPFVECVLAGMALGEAPHHVEATLDRTRLAGELRLGDGALGTERHHLLLSARAQGRNRLAVSAAVIGHEVVVRWPELWADGAVFDLLGKPGSCGPIRGAVSARVSPPTLTLQADEITLQELALGDAPP